MREPRPLLTLNEFINNSIFVIDISNQNELVKTGPIDVKIEFKTSSDIPNETVAYCLLIHDRLVENSLHNKTVSHYACIMKFFGVF